jgi:hypothetical protein
MVERIKDRDFESRLQSIDIIEDDLETSTGQPKEAVPEVLKKGK